MRPFQTKAGGAIEQGIANEAQVIHVLKKEVKDFSNAKYEAGEVREFGLLANRKHRVCTSSPDAVFALMKKSNEGTYNFFAMCVLEIKTLGAENTTALLIQLVLVYGKWTKCELGTD